MHNRRIILLSTEGLLLFLFYVFSKLLGKFRSYALASIGAVLSTSEVGLRIGHDFVALSASKTHLIFEKLDWRATGRAGHGKNVSRFPISRILSWAFHNNLLYYVQSVRQPSLLLRSPNPIFSVAICVLLIKYRSLASQWDDAADGPASEFTVW
jgi:hypothetical protein